MPTTRRSTGGARAQQGPTKGQSTISFSNKVSKPGARDDAKKAIITPAKVDRAIATKREEEQLAPATVDIKIEPEVELEEVEEQTQPEPESEKPEFEIRAENVSDAQIRKYWRDIEALRFAPRVHIDDVSVGEKVLRYFDVSSQYGVSPGSCDRLPNRADWLTEMQPCVGIQRAKRWRRAERLGLNPPIEVLAVLMKEEEKGTPRIQRAHMDEILNSTAVGAN